MQNFTRYVLSSFLEIMPSIKKILEITGAGFVNRLSRTFGILLCSSSKVSVKP